MVVMLGVYMVPPTVLKVIEDLSAVVNFIMFLTFQVFFLEI